MPGAPSTKATSGPKACRQFVLDQRKMRAGEHHGIDKLSARLVPQSRCRPRIDLGVNRLPAQLGLGGHDQFGRSEAQQALVGRKFRFQPVDIGLADRRLGAEQADDASFGHRGRRFDRRDRADNRHLQHIAHHGQRNRRGGVAGDADQPGPIAFGHPAQQPADPRGDFGLAFAAIGQAGVVGGIDHRSIAAEPCAPRPEPTARRRRSRTAGWARRGEESG